MNNLSIQTQTLILAALSNGAKAAGPHDRDIWTKALDEVKNDLQRRHDYESDLPMLLRRQA